MKKFVSMAMVAAMTTSMVPATAFAGVGEVSATAKIVDAWTMTKDFDGNVVDDKDSVPELQIKITDTNYKNSKLDNEDYYAEITVALDNAELDSSFTTKNIGVRLDRDAMPETDADTVAATKLKDAVNALDGTAVGSVDVKKLKAYDEMPWAEYDFEDATDATEDVTWASVGGALKNAYTTANDLEAAIEAADSAAVVTAKENLEDAKVERAALDGVVSKAEDDLTNALKGLYGTPATGTPGEDNYAAGPWKDYKDAEKAYNEAAADYKEAKDLYEGLEADVEAKTKALNKLTDADAIKAAKTELYGYENGGTTKKGDGTTAGDWKEDSLYDKYDVAKKAIEATTEGSVAGVKAAKEADLKTKEAIVFGGFKYNVDAGADKTVLVKGDEVTEANAKITAIEDAQAALEEVEEGLEDAIAEADQAIEDAEVALEEAALADPDVVDAMEDAMEAAQNMSDAIDAYEKAYEAYVEAAKAASAGAAGTFEITAVEGFGNGRVAMKDADEFTFGIRGQLHEGDVIYVDLATVMDKTSVGKQATLDVSSDDLNLDVQDLVYVGVEDYGIKATTKKLANVAEDEEAALAKDLKIESTVGDFAANQEIELKLNNGFEFSKGKFYSGEGYTVKSVDGDKAVIVVDEATDEITIKADYMKITADSAKSGAVATITVKALNNVTGGFKATTKVEVMKVVDYTVIMSVEEDEDVPVIYSGTNVANTGITDDSDHLSLEVTIEESFPGAWSMRKGFNLELPDGVYVTNVDVIETEGLTITDPNYNWGYDVDTYDLTEKFFEAYQEGDHKNFEFAKRVFDDVSAELNEDEASMTFQLELVADPTFHGDVNLKFTGDLIDEQEVTIAKFQPIAVVKAEQNDMKIDYRYTEIPTAVTITETAAGLWKEGSEFWMAIEKGDYMEFEEDAKYEATNGLEVDDFEEDRNFKSIGLDKEDAVNAIGFEVEEESDEAATVTISGLSLFMQRNIPAGAYDLIGANTAAAAYLGQQLFAPDCHEEYVQDAKCTCTDKDNDCVISDVEDFSDVVKEAFVNIVTAGREQDDASFTTKVVVPVGESYIVAGEHQVSLDVPAYVSAAGYTMLPVRAVATALGINNNNVIWNGESRTVTILYGQRIITMAAGEKTVHVNGSVIPASAAVEIVDGRTFLPMRDLATALGVTDITWDAATKTATLNGNA